MKVEDEIEIMGKVTEFVLKFTVMSNTPFEEGEGLIPLCTGMIVAFKLEVD